MFTHSRSDSVRRSAGRDALPSLRGPVNGSALLECVFRAVFRLRIRFVLPHRQVFTLIVPTVACVSRMVEARPQDGQDSDRDRFPNLLRPRHPQYGLQGRVRAQVVQLRSATRRPFVKSSLRQFVSGGDDDAAALVLN
jgi:hypothetical protein